MTALSQAPDLAIEKGTIPRHVAIIMDGNRRWAAQRGLPPLMGHWQGAENLTSLVRFAADAGIKALTVYAFSTENWGRSNEEVAGLMDLFRLYLEEKREELVAEGVRLHAIGDLSRIPETVLQALDATKRATAGGKRIDLVLALNYGGRDELKRAIGKILKRNAVAPIEQDELTEGFIHQFLDTAQWEDPELVIRTSGELRISNFLLWQISYAEFYVTDTLWPDFSKDELYKAILAFQLRKRRWGGNG